MKAVSLKRFLVGAGKLVVTGMVVLGIGWILTSLDPDGDVSESQADIVALGFQPKSDTERFRDALDNLGHEPAKAYELNGNRIYFSVNQFDEPPEQALRIYQDEFVAQQLNDQAFSTISMAEMAARKRTSFSGGVVPLKISPDHVVMGGVSTRGGSKSMVDLVGEFDPDKTPAEVFDAFRWIEVNRSRTRSGSTITATWSDKDFDYEAMFPGTKSSRERRVDERIPVCPGCVKVNQFADQSRPGTHQSYIFTTDMSQFQLRAFYQTHLQQRGWQIDERSDWLDELGAYVEPEYIQMDRLEFRRDDQTLEVATYPTGKSKNAVRIVLVDEKYLNAQGLSARPIE